MRFTVDDFVFREINDNTLIISQNKWGSLKGIYLLRCGTGQIQWKCTCMCFDKGNFINITMFRCYCLILCGCFAETWASFKDTKAVSVHFIVSLLLLYMYVKTGLGQSMEKKGNIIKSSIKQNERSWWLLQNLTVPDQHIGIHILS